MALSPEFLCFEMAVSFRFYSILGVEHKEKAHE
jgi:hypothetical protein